MQGTVGEALWVAIGSNGHVIAQAVGEVGGIDARLDPSPHAVSHSKGNSASVSDLIDKEGILAAQWSPLSSLASQPHEGVVVEQVALRAVSHALGCVRSGYAIGKFGVLGWVPCGRAEQSLKGNAGDASRQVLWVDADGQAWYR